MSAPAWAGWFAVKALWEASLRAGSLEPSRLGEYLARPATRFDGHKGWPLSFRPWDHQLRQPMYLVRGERLLGEVPTRSAPDEASSSQQLDRLGEDEAASRCHPIREEVR
jgi:ABC transporter substrate binding protein (PQQ-dependent alcohol dehydrogenase system)